MFAARTRKTLVLQPDGTAGKDANIYERYPNTNGGASTDLAIGHYAVDDINYRWLAQFDLTTIPTSARVISATLALARQASAGTRAYSYGAYKILRAWTEGTKDFAPADGVTWNKYDGTNSWGTAGCNNTTSDRSATVEGAHTINYAGDNSWDIPLMVQDWIATPATNYGLILMTADAWVAQGFWQGYSSDYATAAKRPKLTIVYEV